MIKFNPDLLKGVDVRKLLDESTPEKKEQILRYMQAVLDYRRYNRIESFVPQAWQKKLFKRGKDLVENGDLPHRALIAGNRLGKSYCGTYELAVHLTGRYPEDWEGIRLDKGGITAIALGVSYAQLAQPKAMQELLVGPKHDRGAGWIPKDDIIDCVNHGPIIKSMTIKHYTNGIEDGISELHFGSYEAGQDVLMGAAYDIVLIDEAPRDAKILPQAITRVLSTKGFVLCVFTPEGGLTQTVQYFWNEDGKGHKGLVRATLWDAEHYTLEEKKQFADSIPPWEYNFRIEGIPSAGGDSIFKGVVKADIIVNDMDFTIKKHWPRLMGIDFGFRDTNVVSFVTKDPDTGIYYMYDEIAHTETEAAVIATTVKPRQLGWIPMVWPTDGDSQRGLGATYVQIYRDAGCILTREFSANRMIEHDCKDREKLPGLAWMRQLMKSGLLKVHARCELFLKEFDTYSFTDNGKVKDGDDHSMDSFRYALTSLDALGITEQEATKPVISYSDYDQDDDTVW